VGGESIYVSKIAVWQLRKKRAYGTDREKWTVSLRGKVGYPHLVRDKGRGIREEICQPCGNERRKLGHSMSGRD